MWTPSGGAAWAPWALVLFIVSFEAYVRGESNFYLYNLEDVFRCPWLECVLLSLNGLVAVQCYPVSGYIFYPVDSVVVCSIQGGP